MTELQLKPTISDADLARDFTRQREDNDDPGLSASFLLPKSWMKFEPYKAPPGGGGLELVCFGRYGDAGSKALVELYAQKLPRELSSADWFEHFAREREYHVEKRHLTDSQAGMNIDALATKRGKSGKPFTYRLATYKNAGRVYLVAGFAPPDDFAAFSEAFVVAVNSFQLLAGGKEWSAEPLRTTRLTRVMPVEFTIPQTWRREVDGGTPSAEIERVHFVNSGKDRTMGRITVAVGTHRAYDTHAGFAEALVRGTAHAPTVDLAPIGANTVSAGSFAMQGVAPFDPPPPGKDRQTLRVLVGSQGNAWVGFALVMHHWGTDPFPVDAINTRAFEIVLRTLGPASAS